MQGYHPSGQYYAQPPYPPQTFVPQYPYPPYPVQPVIPPPNQNYQQFPSAYPQEYEPAPPAQQYVQRPKHIRRSHTVAATPNPKAAPLKSAMKKPQHDRSTSMQSANPTPNLSRTSSRATSEQRHRANSTSSRPRADSLPPAGLSNSHVFIAFHGANELRVENISHGSLVEEFRQTIPFEWPHGVTNEELERHRWRLQFAGTPWASSGMDSIIARNIICALYRILAVQGYSYVTTINTSTPPARLVFELTDPDPLADFFTLLMSQSGDKLSLLGVQPQLAHMLGDSLRATFPHKIASDRAREDGIYIIEMRKGIGAEVDRGIFHAHALRFLSSVGYKLDGSIPMGRAGPLGFGSRKELWIFKGRRQRPPSAQPSLQGQQRDY